MSNSDAPRAESFEETWQEFLATDLGVRIVEAVKGDFAGIAMFKATYASGYAACNIRTIADQLDAGQQRHNEACAAVDGLDKGFDYRAS